MSKSIKLKNNIFWDSQSISYNQETLNVVLDKIQFVYNTITGLSLTADTEYQLALPNRCAFIEPLLEGHGSDYSGGQFIVPGGAFTYITNTDLESTYKGIWMRCESNGKVHISSYRHNGAKVTGFRLWYLKI